MWMTIENFIKFAWHTHSHILSLSNSYNQVKRVMLSLCFAHTHTHSVHLVERERKRKWNKILWSHRQVFSILVTTDEEKWHFHRNKTHSLQNSTKHQTSLSFSAYVSVWVSLSFCVLLLHAMLVAFFGWWVTGNENMLLVCVYALYLLSSCLTISWAANQVKSYIWWRLCWNGTHNFSFSLFLIFTYKYTCVCIFVCMCLVCLLIVEWEHYYYPSRKAVKSGKVFLWNFQWKSIHLVKYQYFALKENLYVLIFSVCDYLHKMNKSFLCPYDAYEEEMDTICILRGCGGHRQMEKVDFNTFSSSTTTSDPNNNKDAYTIMHTEIHLWFCVQGIQWSIHPICRWRYAIASRAAIRMFIYVREIKCVSTRRNEQKRNGPHISSSHSLCTLYLHTHGGKYSSIKVYKRGNICIYIFWRESSPLRSFFLVDFTHKVKSV